METKEIKEEEVKEKTNELVVRAKGVVVNSDETYQAAGLFLKEIKGFRRQVAEKFGAMSKKAHAAWKEAKSIEKSFDDPLVTAENIIKPLIGAWHTMLKEKEQAEREKVRLEEMKRLEEERLAAAKLAEEEGRNKEAQRIIEKPVFVPRPKTESKAVSGISTRKTYGAEVVDPMELVKAVAAGKAPLKYLEASMKELRAAAKFFKEDFEVPGVKLICEESVSSR